MDLDYVDVESFDSWRGFLGDPRRHGVSGVRLVTSDAHAGLRRAVEEVSAIDPRAGGLLEDAREDALAYLSFPAEHRLKIRTNNVQERVNREIKRRTDAVQVCPSVSCRLNHARNSAYKSPRVTSRKPLPSLARFLIPSLNSLFEKIT